MRRAEGPLVHHGFSRLQQPGHRKNLGGFQGLLIGHIRQNRGQSLGHHAFASPRRADEQHMMRAGGGHFQRPFDAFLPHHIREIRPLGGLALIPIGRGRRQRNFSPQMGDQLFDMPHGNGDQPFGHRRFGGVFRRHKHPPGPALQGGQGHGQNAGGGTQAPVQRKFADKAAVRLSRRNLP